MWRWKSSAAIQALLACALSSNLPSVAPGLPLPDRAAGALWGLFVGDALAMPVHLGLL